MEALGAGGLLFVIVAGLVILAAALGQWLAFRRRESLLSRPQLVLRLVTAALLLAVLGLSVYGVVSQTAQAGQALAPAERIAVVRAAVVYWSVVIGLLMAAVVMALLDLRYLRATRHRVRATMYENMARLQQDLRAAQAQRQAPPPSQEEAGEPSAPPPP
ncbi:MAG TPA: hypothetical protein VGM19_02920 [Armatimonadota bacterium]|jgi:TRAP-type C4-dicarboxylate transport system permease small subunit